VQQIQGKIDESNLYVIKLPQSLRQHFSKIFEDLDNPEVKERLNIDTYNVRVTSLEEVFNTLGEEEMSRENQDNLSANNFDDQDRELDQQQIEFKKLSD